MIEKKALAFLKRDFLIASSYQLHFIMTSMNSLLILFLLFFIGKIVDPSYIGLTKYGQDFFSYILIGYGFFQFFQIAQNTFSQTIRDEQLSGCLEAMLGTQTSPQLSILFSSLYSLITAFFQLCIIFIAGILFFKFNILGINIFSTFIVFLLSIIIFMSFGLLSVAFIIVLKKGDPISWLITSLNFILGGAFFPIEVLPPWVRIFSKILPATYVLDSLRLTISKGYDLLQIRPQILVLVIMCLILAPASLFILHTSVIKAKKDGTLVHY
ncbi:MAG: ABC transporter permease [Spirochaetales bacterium]|nr:ABC transporter permease [Spirochaetales bacterium]